MMTNVRGRIFRLIRPIMISIMAGGMFWLVGSFLRERYGTSSFSGDCGLTGSEESERLVFQHGTTRRTHLEQP